ncbi:MAG: thymidylate synthase [Bacteroidia bacterium]|nr:thymidylate synthase [Bacteroidia bacterium]MDW8158337.1 thymidylate synthase [Bacteroidia bacterium]
MENYLALIENILKNGEARKDRTGVGTLSIFGQHLKFNLKEGFPLLTNRKIHFKSIVIELLWFIKGDTNTDFLHQHNVTIWDEWADENGNLGPIYGKQWRAWKAEKQTIDQLRWVIEEIKKNPHSRRLLVSAWNVGELGQMKLPPCHHSFQFYVSKQGLSCLVNQRSCDVFLGLPFNIASYALLTAMVAQVTHLETHELHFFLGDTHLYTNHIEQAHLLLSRKPYPLPTIRLNPAIQNIDDFTYQDIELINYQYHPPIHAPVAV